MAKINHFIQFRVFVTKILKNIFFYRDFEYEERKMKKKKIKMRIREIYNT